MTTISPVHADSLSYSPICWFSTTNSANGYYPYAGLVQGSDGDLYGTTILGGGTSNHGTIFKCTTTGSLTTLHQFGAVPNDGYSSTQPLAAINSTTFYGTTNLGGTGGDGTLYFVTSTGSYSIVHDFAGGTTDGASPDAGVVKASDGNLYGTTSSGGVYGLGVLYRYTLGGTFTILHSFAGGSTDAASPGGGLIQDSSGYLYGTSSAGGSANDGTVFRITTSGVVTILHSFTAGKDGYIPTSGVILASDGNLYGVTEEGGSSNDGTVFTLSKTGTGYLIIHTFTGDGVTNDGAEPCGRPLQATNGRIYGTTLAGGLNDNGALYSVTTSHTYEVYTTEFPYTYAGFIQATNGNLYSVDFNDSFQTGEHGNVFESTIGS